VSECKPANIPKIFAFSQPFSSLVNSEQRAVNGKTVHARRVFKRSPFTVHRLLEAL